jgi:GT2 family glycosyltransferase
VQRFAPTSAEVIVVDDASADARVTGVVQAFAGVRVVRLPRRREFCGAVNAGVAAARSPVVQLLNDDAEVTAGWAEPALAHFARPDVAAVAPLVLRWPDGRVIDSAGDGYYVGGVARKRGHGEPLRGEFLSPGPVFSASGCGAFYRKDALLAVGGFPEDFGAYFDDIDVGFRLRRAGYDIWYEPASRVLHHGSASYGRRPGRRLLEQQSRNEERVFWRNLPPALWSHALPRHAAVLLGKALRRWGRGELTPFLMGRLRAWAEAVRGPRAAGDAGRWCLDLSWGPSTI